MERYKCKHCENTYASMSSRSNHIKRVHCLPIVHNVSIPSTNGTQMYTNSPIELKQEIVNCKFCNKKLCNRKSRWRHEQICKSKDNKDIKDNVTKEIIENIKKKILEDEDLRTEILKSLKIHPKDVLDFFKKI